MNLIAMPHGRTGGQASSAAYPSHPPAGARSQTWHDYCFPGADSGWIEPAFRNALFSVIPREGGRSGRPRRRGVLTEGFNLTGDGSNTAGEVR